MDLVSQAAIFKLGVSGVRSWPRRAAEGPRLGRVPAPAPPVSPSPHACLNHSVITLPLWVTEPTSLTDPTKYQVCPQDLSPGVPPPVAPQNPILPETPLNQRFLGALTLNKKTRLKVLPKTAEQTESREPPWPR